MLSLDGSIIPIPATVVLVVDDEALIRMYASDVLEDAGCVPVEAENADDALRQLAAYPKISVLFTDINMPGALSGLDLARVVHAQRPDIQIIIASGKMRPLQAEIPDDGRFCSKPYDAQEIVGIIAADQIRRGIQPTP